MDTLQQDLTLQVVEMHARDATYIGRVLVSATESEDDLVQRSVDCRSYIVGYIDETYRMLNLVHFFLGALLAIGSMYWWHVNRDRQYLKVRSYAASVITTLGYLISLVALPLYRWSLDEMSFLNNCSVQTFLLHTGTMIVLSSSILRYTVSYYKYRLLEEVIKDFAYNQTKGSHRGSFSSRTAVVILTGDRASKSQSNPRSKDVSSAAQKFMYLSSQRFTRNLGVFLVLLSLLIGALMTLCLCPDLNLVTCDKHRNGIVQAVIGTLYPVFWLVFYVILKYRSKDYPDPFGLIHEVFIAVLIVVCLFPWVMFVVLTEHKELESFPIAYDPKTAYDAILTTLFLYLVPYQVFRSSRQKEFNLQLGDVLNHRLGTQLFNYHLFMELSSPNLSFWTVVQEWKKSYKETGSELREKIALNIFRKFFSQESLNEMNVSCDVKEKLRQEIHANGIIKVTVFDEAADQIFKLMEEDSFFRFKVNGMYRYYMGLDDGVSI